MLFRGVGLGWARDSGLANQHNIFPWPLWLVRDGTFPSQNRECSYNFYWVCWHKVSVLSCSMWPGGRQAWRSLPPSFYHLESWKNLIHRKLVLINGKRSDPADIWFWLPPPAFPHTEVNILSFIFLRKLELSFLAHAHEHSYTSFLKIPLVFIEYPSGKGN